MVPSSIIELCFLLVMVPLQISMFQCPSRRPNGAMCPILRSSFIPLSIPCEWLVWAVAWGFRARSFAPHPTRSARLRILPEARHGHGGGAWCGTVRTPEVEIWATHGPPMCCLQSGLSKEVMFFQVEANRAHNTRPPSSVVKSLTRTLRCSW